MKKKGRRQPPLPHTHYADGGGRFVCSLVMPSRAEPWVLNFGTVHGGDVIKRARLEGGRGKAAAGWGQGYVKK